MKRGFIVALLITVLIFTFCSIGVAAIKNSPDGFGGVKWGDPPSKLGARDKVWSDSFVSEYEKKNEKLAFGAVNASKITYMFMNDREMFCVVITVEGADSFSKFRDTLIARYGEPTAGQSETQCFWWDEKVNITYTYYDQKEYADLIIHSNNL